MRSAGMVLLCLLALAAPAQAASVSSADGVVRVSASRGEANRITVADVLHEGVAMVAVFDNGARPDAGPGCRFESHFETVLCPYTGLRLVTASLGDHDDEADFQTALPVYVRAGSGDDLVRGGLGVSWIEGEGGDDRLTGRDRADTLIGGEGDDALAGAGGDDRLAGGSGADRISGAEGDDRIEGGAGRDSVSAGPGADRIKTRDGDIDAVVCGEGRDRLLVDARDSLHHSCGRARRGQQARSMGVRFGRHRTRARL